MARFLFCEGARQYIAEKERAKALSLCLRFVGNFFAQFLFAESFQAVVVIEPGDCVFQRVFQRPRVEAQAEPCLGIVEIAVDAEREEGV